MCHFHTTTFPAESEDIFSLPSCLKRRLLLKDKVKIVSRNNGKETLFLKNEVSPRDIVLASEVFWLGTRAAFVWDVCSRGGVWLFFLKHCVEHLKKYVTKEEKINLSFVNLERAGWYTFILSSLLFVYLSPFGGFSSWGF